MKMKTEPDIVWIPPAEMKRRIDTIPLPKKVKSSFVHLVLKWQSNSGTEWTVGRLKSFKDCLLNSYSEGGTSISHKPEWFRTTPSGRLHGIFGDLWVIAMRGAAQLEAVLNIVNIYTACHRKTWNQEILEEIKTSVERPGPRLPKRGHGVRSVGRTSVFKALSKLGWHKSLKYNIKPNPITWQLPGKESHVLRVPSDLRMVSASQLSLSAGARNLVHEAAGSWLASEVFTQWLPIVGDIHLSHEPGLKTRYFAAPNLVYQQALEPLKNALLGFLKKVPWDCTLEQRKADKRILKRLSHGCPVYSVDLSKATDRFPWEFQSLVLSNLLRGKEARSALGLFRAIVEQGFWELPDGSPTTFNAGQPLGLGPSFPTFTLAHGILLYILNGYKWDESFYVLGDDVIIFTPKLYMSYMLTLAEWDVPVSSEKSFTSGTLAQFAGVTYTPDKSFWVPKWRPFTRSNLVDLSAWWYPGLTKGFPENSLIERVLSLPAPYGIGRNPKGLPLEDRLTPELVEVLVDREVRREAEAKASVTRCDVNRLIRTLRRHGTDDNTLVELVHQINQALSLAQRVIDWNVAHGSTKPSLRRDAVMLAHETEIAGYPRLRFHEDRVDPYSLGSLNMWKRIFKRVDSDQNPSVES